jgi:hypothetical protein
MKTYSPSLFHLAKHLSPLFHFNCLQITILFNKLSSLAVSFGWSAVSPINSCVNLMTSYWWQVIREEEKKQFNSSLTNKSPFKRNNSSFSGSFLSASSA